MVGLSNLTLPVLPQTFVDTTGWAFTYPLAKLAGARVAAYTHYPTVSADMLQRVQVNSQLLMKGA